MMTASRIGAITFDCADPERLAEFWATVLGYQRREPSGEFLVLADPAGTGPRLLFGKVPEPKIAKNRVHIDLSAPNTAEIERLIGLGATLVDTVERPNGGWTVMRDPEGNEFCV